METTITPQLRSSRLSTAAGALIEDIETARPLSSEQVTSVMRTLGDHCVVVFRDVRLTPKEHIEFSQQFGTLEQHVMSDVFGLPGFPEILVVSNVKEDGKLKGAIYAGQYWHSDVSYMEKPSVGSLLLCREMPDVGGDTMFANMYLAYETLSKPLKDFLGGLEAVHDYNKIYETHFSKFSERPPLTAEQRAKAPPRSHPVVRTHPVTGRKALYVNPGFTTGFVGMPYEESQPILDFLFQHSTRPEFTYRHKWQVNDLVFWDNRCAMHYAMADYDQSVRRHMHRTTVAGDQPY